MPACRLAACLDSYRLGLRESLDTAAAQGFRHVQLNALHGELDPRSFSGSARRHLRKFLRDLGLEIDACAANFPGWGLADPAHADERLARFGDAVRLCKDLGVPRCTVTIGGTQDARPTSLAGEMYAAVADLAARATMLTSVSAGETPWSHQVEALRKLRCPHLRAALDAAQLLADPPAPEALAGLVGTLYLRDLRRAGAAIEEVPLGQGDVDFPALLGLADAADGTASLVIRRDTPAGVDALRQGREYIATLIGR